MNINIRHFLFNELNKLEESKNTKSINDLLLEGYTPIELEKHSMSFQHGNLLIGENGRLLVFESKLFNEQVPILLEHELNEFKIDLRMQKNNSIFCLILNSPVFSLLIIIR